MITHTSLKQKTIEKIKALLDIQEIDIEIIRIFDLKKERIAEWKNLDEKQLLISQGVQEKRQNIFEIEKNIEIKNIEISNTQEEITKFSELQSQSRKADDYNMYQQKIVEAKKKISFLEESLDLLYARKISAESLLKEIEIDLIEFCKTSFPRASEIYHSVLNLNAEGRRLVAKKNEKIVLIDPKLRLIYETLIRTKGTKAVVKIEDKSCSGCNILITDQAISIIKKCSSITRCEHCSCILYQDQDEISTAVEKKMSTRNRVVTLGSIKNFE